MDEPIATPPRLTINPGSLIGSLAPMDVDPDGTLPMPDGSVFYVHKKVDRKMYRNHFTKRKADSDQSDGHRWLFLIKGAPLPSRIKRPRLTEKEENQDEDYQEGKTRAGRRSVVKLDSFETTKRAAIRMALIAEVKGVQSVLDSGTKMGPEVILDHLLQRLESYSFTRFSQTLARYELSIPQLHPPPSSHHAPSSKDAVSYVVRPRSHLSQTLFIEVKLGADFADLVRFAVTVNKLDISRAPTNVYLTAPTFYIHHPTNPHCYVAISQILKTSPTPNKKDENPPVNDGKDEKVGKDENLSCKRVDVICSVGGEVRTSKMDSTTAGRPLKCSLKLLSSAEIRFDIYRSVEMERDPLSDIRLYTKVKRTTDSRNITENTILSFIPVPN